MATVMREITMILFLCGIYFIVYSRRLDTVMAGMHKDDITLMFHKIGLCIWWFALCWFVKLVTDLIAT